MYKHTDGPWTVGNRYGNLHTEIAAPGYTKAVAYCWTHKDANQKDDKARRLFNEDAEGLANARLIAAAPDLLEACKAALPFCTVHSAECTCGGGGVDPNCERHALADQLRAAIAKATT